VEVLEFSGVWRWPAVASVGLALSQAAEQHKHSSSQPPTTPPREAISHLGALEWLPNCLSLGMGWFYLHDFWGFCFVVQCWGWNLGPCTCFTSDLPLNYIPSPWLSFLIVHRNGFISVATLLLHFVYVGGWNTGEPQASGMVGK
jgi:hypothetical protein